MDERALFLVRVTEGRQRDVLRAALHFRAVRHGAPAGRRELLLFMATRDAASLGDAARALAQVDGVEAVDCSLMVEGGAAAAPA